MKTSPKYDGVTIREVLDWASGNVETIAKNQDRVSEWWVGVSKEHWVKGTTLYDAIYEAWLQRQTAHPEG